MIALDFRFAFISPFACYDLQYGHKPHVLEFLLKQVELDYLQCGARYSHLL